MKVSKSSNLTIRTLIYHKNPFDHKNVLNPLSAIMNSGVTKHCKDTRPMAYVPTQFYLTTAAAPHKDHY